jgi:protein-S-isoprenylcysteine O-methyltransferase Ste14
MPPTSPAPAATTPAGGGWLFRRRSSLPVPIALVLLLVRWGMVQHPAIDVVGPLLVLGGEALRWWAVGQIGVISRTRSTRLGPLITTGPFALCRNPLYVGNLLLWTGFTIWSGLLWMVPVTLAVFGSYYASIIGWEEALLRERFGDDYERYCAETPRWWPRANRLSTALSASAMHDWREVAFSERGTLIAIAVGGVLLVARLHAS